MLRRLPSWAPPRDAAGPLGSSSPSPRLAMSSTGTSTVMESVLRRPASPAAPPSRAPPPGPGGEAATPPQRPVGGRQADPLGLGLSQSREPLEADGQVGATLVGSERVDLGDEDPADAPKHLAGLAREEQEERLGVCDQDVRRPPIQMSALL